MDELIRRMGLTSFNARRLSKAVDILEEMIKEEGCIKFLGLAGALIPGGMRSHVVELIRHGWVDIIVSSGANVTHDIAQCFGEEYTACEPAQVNDAELRKKGFERIYDTLLPTRTMEIMEKGIQRILSSLTKNEYSTYELMAEIGKRIKDENSFISMAANKGVKVIVPGLVDSILGIQVWMRAQTHSLRINELKDLDYLINLNFDLKKEGRNTGALILGGGVPKNFILQSVLVADKPHKYVVQITTEPVVWGGLSGATLSEAISWGKVAANSKLCTVYCDVTIALPLIVSALKERFS